MTSRLIAGLFGLPGRARAKAPATPRSGHELPACDSDFEPCRPHHRHARSDEPRLAEALLFGVLMRR